MQKVREILVEILGKQILLLDDEQVVPNNVITWDSLNHLKIILSLENEFGIDILPDDITKMKEGLISIMELLKKYGVDIK